MKLNPRAQDPETVNMRGFQAAVQLAVDRMALYKEDADSATKLTKDKGGRKKKALIMHGDYRGQDTHSQHFQLIA